MYVVLEKDYQKLSAKEVYRCFSLNECHYKIEELAKFFIESKEGQANNLIYGQHCNKILRPKKGYYMKKSKNFNKISIYNKFQKKGYFSNETLNIKILSYEIIKVKAAGFEYRDYNDFYLFLDEYCEKDKFEKVFCEIEKLEKNYDEIEIKDVAIENI